MEKKKSSKRPERDQFQSMRVGAGVREFVLDQLSDLDGLRAKDMFGGVGLYAHDVFFGILAADILYFKVDDSNRPDYDAAGSKPFRPYADRPMTMPYYRVPVSVLESAPTLVQWADRAVAVARAGKKSVKKIAKKAAKKSAPGAPRKLPSIDSREEPDDPDGD